MAVTPVEYLIKANDQFTPVMRSVDAGLKQHQQTVAEMAKGGKAAADSMNKLGSVMGMMPVSQLAGQVSALAMQIRGMNAASAAGAQNLALMRLGMVGLAAAAGYQLGQSLAELIYNTTEVGKRIDAATRQIDEGYDRLLQIQKQSRQEQLMDIELIRDPEEKSKRQKDYFDKLQSDLERVNNRIGHDTALLQRYTEEFTIFRAERAENIKETEQRIAQEEKLRQQLQAEVDTIRERNRLEAKFAARQAEDKRLNAIEDMVSKLEQQNEQLRIGTHEYQKQQELINVVTDAERQRITQLQEERERLQAAEADRQKAEQERLKTEQASDSFLQNLEAQLILLRDGQEAADEYRARLAGVSEEAIEQGRLLRKEIAALQDAQEETADKLKTSFTPGVTAKETRLLTGRSGVRDDPVFKVQQNTFALLKEFREEKRTQRNQLEELRLIRRGRRIGQFVP
jgi:uncharacterized phage infection (PIP) family protein YhgE